MRVTLIALATFATVLFLAPAADAWSDGRSSRSKSSSSASSFQGSSGSVSSPAAGGNGGGRTALGTSEPLAALAVGLGLLGARYLRRR